MGCNSLKQVNRKMKRGKLRSRRERIKRNKAETAIVLAKPVPAPIQVASAIPKIEETIKSLERVRRFVSKALNRDLQVHLAKLEKRGLKGKDLADEEKAIRQRFEVDWGTIPGVDKPFLMQPGAEKFMFWLQLRPHYDKHEREMSDGHLEMVCSVSVFHKKTGELVFEGPDCSCTTMETNFRYVWAEMQKPTDDVADRLKEQRMGRNFKKVKWVKGNRIEEWVWQQRVENPNPWEKRNTVRQIGEKRALVKCIRNMGAISEIFTADPSEWDIPEESEDPRDEMDYTPSGRKIFTEDGSSPSGRYQDTRKPTGEARGPKGGDATTPRPTPPPAFKEESGEHRADTKPTSVAPPAKVAAPIQKPKAKIILTWPAEKDGCGYLSGDLASILATIQKEIVCQWLESKRAHAIPANEAHVVADIAAKHGYEFVEVSGSLTPAAPAPDANAQAKPESVARGTAGVSETPSGHARATGIINSAKPGKTSKTGAQYMDVNLSGFTHRCYNRDLHAFVNAAVGKEAEFIVDAKKIIVGIVRIANRTFDSDGKTPIVQLHEERPKDTPSLFND